MLLRAIKFSRQPFIHIVGSTSKLHRVNIQLFSILTEQRMAEYPTREVTTSTKPVLSQATNSLTIKEYLKTYYKCAAATSIIGIGVTYLLSTTIPVGLPSALMFVNGFAFEHLGADYIEKSKPSFYTYKGKNGSIHYGTENTPLRKFALASVSLGYGLIMGSLMTLQPFGPAVLAISGVTCLCSTLGQFLYCRFGSKKEFKPSRVLWSGTLTGFAGLMLVESITGTFMGENILEYGTYGISSMIGLSLFNVFSAYDSEKMSKEVANGKGDYILHASKFGR